jgi:hypothetical protein
MHDRPANRQCIRTRRSCELYKGMLLHDRDVWNRQYTQVGATLQIDIGSYSSRSFGDLRVNTPVISYRLFNYVIGTGSSCFWYVPHYRNYMEKH